MAGFIASIDARTMLAGRNRMELLLFRLEGKQRFGINVFKVREVIQCPPLTQLPDSHRAVRGIINIRGKTMAVLDLGLAVGMPALRDPDNAFLVVTEYNAAIQGFLVASVDRIVNHNWQEILPPPQGEAAKGYLTAVTHVDDELVEIIDVERVLHEIMGNDLEVSDDFTDAVEEVDDKKLVLIADDSVVARKQVCRTLVQLGCDVVQAKDGEEAFDILNGWLRNDAPELKRLSLIISDIEMPRMDGYTLTSAIRRTDGLKHYRVLLHTSLSGGFNKAMVEKVGADQFVAKFDPDILAKAVLEHRNKDHDLSGDSHG